MYRPITSTICFSILSVFFVFAATFADENSEIIIKPGSSVTLKPHHKTTVTCEGSEATLVESYCVCLDITRTSLSKVYVYSNGSVKTVQLQNTRFNGIGGGGEAACLALASGEAAHPACKVKESE